MENSVTNIIMGLCEGQICAVCFCGENDLADERVSKNAGNLPQWDCLVVMEQEFWEGFYSNMEQKCWEDCI